MARFLWTQKRHIGPNPRLGHAMAYDDVRGCVVLFGGDSLRAKLFNDTWEWDGENWTQMDDIGPSPRADHAMGFESDQKQTLLFGGNDGTKVLGDTWAWDGENWTQLASDGPASRSGHSMVYDSNRKRVVLFGGLSAGGQLLNDTWEWDGNEWTQQEDVGPSARKAHSMAYDSVRQRTVLFGGAAADGSSHGDTWEWDGSSWAEIVDFGATPCQSAALAFANTVTLFGGITSTLAAPPPQVLGDTWEWDGKRWAAKQDMGPTPRWRLGLTYDSKRKNLVLFGGLPVAPTDANAADKLLGDTWEHQVADNTPPPPPNVTGIQSLDLAPSSTSPGPMITATITLKGAANIPTIVEMEMCPQRLLGPPNTLPSGATPMPSVQIPPGVLSATTQFSSAAMTESMAIVAVADGVDTVVVAILTITP
jgi:hypothetical protein